MTYLGLAAVFLLPAAAVAVVASAVRGLGARWWATTGVVAAVLLVLTVVFDSLMIAADLFRYGEGALSGVRLRLAPLEDLAWPLAAALLLPALWELLGRRRRDDERVTSAATTSGGE
jgi:lycopene cyclase domain-containing protein